MKKNLFIGLMAVAFLATDGMELDTLENNINQNNSFDKTFEVFNREYHDLLKLISQDQRNNVIKIMEENRQNLVSHVMSNKESISSQELEKQYGLNAREYFESYILYGTAMLDIMNNKDYLEKSTNRVKEKNQLKLAVLINAFDSLESKIVKKRNGKKINIEENSNTLLDQNKTIDQNKTKKNRFDRNSSQLQLLKNALCSHYASLYRAFPKGDEDLILEKFMDEYPKFAIEIINPENKKTRKKTPHSRTNSFFNIEKVEDLILENSESVSKVYERYKVLKALLESVGINVGSIQTAVNKNVQIIVDGLIEKAKNLDDLISKKLENCCKII